MNQLIKRADNDRKLVLATRRIQRLHTLIRNTFKKNDQSHARSPHPPAAPSMHVAHTQQGHKSRAEAAA